MLAGIGTVAGLGMSLAGIGIGANKASQRQRQLNELSEMPGIDVGGTYGESLGAIEGAQGAAESIASRQTRYNQAILDEVLGRSIPGYAQMQQQRVLNAQAMLEGRVPEDVAQYIRRQSAAGAATRGALGAPVMENDYLRNLGLTSLDLMGRGQQYSSDIIGTTPLPKIADSSALLNITPEDVLGLKSKERTEKIGLKLTSIGAPGASDVWGSGLQQLGGSMMGLGLGGLLGGGGGGSGSGGGSSWGSGTGLTIGERERRNSITGGAVLNNRYDNPLFGGG